MISIKNAKNCAIIGLSILIILSSIIFPVSASGNPPTQPTVDVTPDNPTTTNDLTCTITTSSTDPEDDLITYTYVWDEDGTTTIRTIAGATSLTDILPASMTTKGKTYTCTVTPNDGTSNGTSDSDYVIVLNSPPTQPTVDVTPDNPITTDDLTCTITTTSTDLDNDLITYTYVWDEDGITIQTTPGATSLTDTLLASDTEDGSIYTCTVTPNDGTINGVPNSDSVAVGNIPPTITGENPINRSTNQPLKITVGATVNDLNTGAILTATFATNVSGVWVNKQTNGNLVDSSIINWLFTEADTPGTCYWWRVYLDDEVNNESYTFNFTTTYAPDTPSKPTGPTTGKTGIIYNFNTSTTDFDGDQIRYGWDWNGDSIVDEWSEYVSPGTYDNRSHYWETAGTYNVKALANDSFKVQSAFSEERIVKINFTVDAGGHYDAVVGINVTFTGSASGTSGTYTTWLWDFGDGGTSNQQNPKHKYTSARSYTANLTVTDSTSEINKDTATVTITINNPPTTPKTPTPTTGYEDPGSTTISYGFSTNATDQDKGDQIRYGWDWNGDSIVDEWSNYVSSEVPATLYHIWETAGTYYVKVQAEDKLPQKSVFSEPFIVTIKSSGGDGGGNGGGSGSGAEEDTNKPPVANAGGPYTGLINQNITFNGSRSYDKDGHITNYTWNFGDSKIGYGISPVHKYNYVGIFTVKLIVTDDKKSISTNITKVTISKPTEPVDNNETEEPSDNTSINESDMIPVEIEGKTYYFIDSDDDGKPDLFYDPTSKIITEIAQKEDGSYMIDKNGDGTWDYNYKEPTESTTTNTGKKQNKGLFSAEASIVTIGIIAIVLVTILTIIILFKIGYLYVEAEKPRKKSSTKKLETNKNKPGNNTN